ncbi:uncharacterized protein LOC117780980 [Drosophila innubila]|uniref:uncharacterized protein LOC117780980 n=1 Tax=Drosophila innubila TaxID=198719 RepID=UPI00148E4A1E|nr:uncharacterized protein LOC117780980 [Drosophila innubila]
MDISDIQWLQKVVPLAYKALKTLSSCPKRLCPTSTSQLLSSSPLIEQQEETAVPESSSKRRRKIQTLHSGRQRRIWVRKENLSRDVDGLFATAFYNARNQEEFCMRTGMTPQVFDMLFSLVGEQLNKNSIRRPISPECRLFLTLVYLTNVESIQDLSKAFEMGSSTVRAVVPETSEVLWNTLEPAFMPQPNWSNIVEGYQQTWEVPHCLGAVDAKLLDVDYKGANDIILLASCDTNLNFTCIDIATVTDAVDNQLHWHYDFGSQLLDLQLVNILPPEPLQSGKDQKDQENFVYTFIADSSFPMREHLITPYKSRYLDFDQFHFNRHLSRALAGSIDKAFNLLLSRWRLLSQPLRQSPSNAEKIVRAAVVLHNFVKQHEETYCPVDYLEELSMCPIQQKVPNSLLSSCEQRLVNCNATIRLQDCMKNLLSAKLESTA